MWGIQGNLTDSTGASDTTLAAQAILQGHADRINYLGYNEADILESVAEDGTDSHIGMRVDLFGVDYDLDEILLNPESRYTSATWDSIYRHSMENLGVELEGRDFVESESHDSRNVMDLYGSSLRAFSHPGGTFKPDSTFQTWS